MPKDRVRANNPALPAITRRSALAAPLALLPGAALADRPSPIIRLFHRHRQVLNACDAHPATAPQEEFDRLFYRDLDQLTTKLLSIPSTSATDFAAKLIIDSCDGTAFSDWETGPLWIEARALTGCPVR